MVPRATPPGSSVWLGTLLHDRRCSTPENSHLHVSCTRYLLKDSSLTLTTLMHAFNAILTHIDWTLVCAPCRRGDAATMAPSIDLSAPVLGDLSPQALVEEHYKAAPDLPLGKLGTGLASPGIRCALMHQPFGMRLLHVMLWEECLMCEEPCLI